MRFKSVLGAFIFVVLASAAASIIFIQTETFGRVLTKIISDLSQRRIDADVGIKNVGISIFPPGIELNRVSIKKDLGADKKFFAEFGQLGFYVGLIEFEEKKLTLGEVRISDSVIEYYDPEEQKDALEKIDQKVIDNIFEVHKNLPLRIDTVLLENSKIVINHEVAETKRLKLFKSSDAFMARFHLANLNPVKNSGFIIDEVWGDAEIGRKDINIQRLRIQHDVHTLLIKGKIKNYPLLKNAEASILGETSIYIRHLKGNIPLPELIKLEDGFAHLSFKTSLKNQNMNGTFDVSISDLVSSVAKAEQLIASLELKDEVLSLNQLSLKNGEEKLRLLKNAEILNLSTKKYLYRPLTVQVEKLELNNALRILPSLNILKGNLTGVLDFKHENGNLDFRPESGFQVHDLRLVTEGEAPFTILNVKRAKLTNSSFRLVKGEFQMDSLLELNHSFLDVHGKVNSRLVDFKVDNAAVDLEDFGNISGLDIKGKGNLDLAVTGALEDVSINIKGKTKGFEVLGYRLGQTEKDLTIALGDSDVVIHKLEAVYRNTPLSGSGVINYKSSDIALGINSPKTTFVDLKEILYPIFSKIDFLPVDLNMLAKIDVNIFGKTSLDNLKIKSDVRFTDLVAYGENASEGSFTVGLNKQLLTISDFKAQKGKGDLRGDSSFDLKTTKLKVSYFWDDLSLLSFNLAKKLKLNLNGNIFGSLIGEGTPKDFELKLIGKMEDTKTSDYEFDDSHCNLSISSSGVGGKFNLLGSIITSNFNYSSIKTVPSSIDLSVQAPTLKPFMTAILGQHLRSEDFTGSLKFKVKSDIKGYFNQVDLLGTLENLTFNHEDFKVNYNAVEPQFIISNNEIQRWNLAIHEPDLFVQSKGQGKFGDQVSLIQDFHFNSKIFEILLSPILSSSGFVRNIFRLDGRGDQYSFSSNSKSVGLDLTIDFLPVPLNQLSYSADYSNNRLVIYDFRTNLDNGALAFKGDIFFDAGTPDVNIKFSMDKAEIPILGKSLLNLSGEGIILGNDLPYSVAGEVIVNRANIINELNEFSSKSAGLSDVRFLPPHQESPFSKLLNLNVNVKTGSPVRIVNSLMDVSLAGEVMLMGNPMRPRGEGHVSAPGNSSRVFFKNNEYTITSADLNFTPKKEITNPDFDIQALTLISSYKVNLRANGDLERFSFDLTSEPALARNSILSLIAFGYSDEIQSTLTQEQQQNLTGVGVGSFVFDRFKISDILNKQFGLQVNLGTVFEQSQTASLLSGRSQEGQGTLGRTRSATKIELKKRLDEALSLSVSSTMGGSIGQRQSMNLNYSVSKKVQLEGVYELRTNDEGQEDLIDNSIGGDLKFRWTFK